MPDAPYRPVDAEARALTSEILCDAPFAALATITKTGAPSISRIAFALVDGYPMTLISTLSDHTQALIDRPTCALLLGEPGAKGDPLTHPRLTLHATASFLDKTDPAYADVRESWLTQRPKSQLYIDFGDFGLLRFLPASAFLNGGFGKAYQLTLGEIQQAMSG